MRLEDARARYGPTPRCPSCFAPLDSRSASFLPYLTEEGLLFESMCEVCAGYYEPVLRRL